MKNKAKSGFLSRVYSAIESDLYYLSSKVEEKEDGLLASDIKKQTSARKRLGATTKGQIFNFENPDVNVWVGEIFVGSAYDSLNVLLDTATDLVAIDEIDCKLCEDIKLA